MAGIEPAALEFARLINVCIIIIDSTYIIYPYDISVYPYILYIQKRLSFANLEL